MDDEATAVMREPGSSAHETWAMGSLFEHLLVAGESAGRLGVAVVTQPPGIATPLHRHTREAEAFYLLEGEMSYRAGEEQFELYAGCFMYLPQGLPHAFRTRGTSPVRYLALTEPGHLLGLYDEVGVPAAARRIPGEGEGLPMAEEIARWNEVGPRYGLEVVGPPIPEEAPA
ncbi:Cupin domain-containing protein [Nocardioides exalbidus]|uniref:Cupin domain-containing protein n=1 Tax=Nocardioides exalbidus TaxID=402596 RepID=A0A1H4M5Q3_9ACTN|nr:cupin domain-containing protein [Nocardioides exalbidus]SEB78104.1 Cupin domain-containing protein [Nocardioides exalbidus]